MPLGPTPPERNGKWLLAATLKEVLSASLQANSMVYRELCDTIRGKYLSGRWVHGGRRLFS